MHDLDACGYTVESWFFEYSGKCLGDRALGRLTARTGSHQKESDTHSVAEDVSNLNQSISQLKRLVISLLHEVSFCLLYQAFRSWGVNAFPHRGGALEFLVMVCRAVLQTLTVCRTKYVRCNFSVSIFRSRLQNPYLFSVLVCKIHIHIGLLDYTHFQANNNLKLTKMAQNHTPCNSHMDTYPYGCYKGFTLCTPSSPGWCTKNVELRENSSEEILNSPRKPFDAFTLILRALV